MFSIKYAFQSISRRPKKNAAGVLAIALGVMLLVGVQAGSNGIEKAFASSWLDAAGGTDIHFYNPAEGFLPLNTSDLIEQSADPRFDTIKTITPMNVMTLSYYAQGQFEKGLVTFGIDPDAEWAAGYNFKTTSGSIIDLDLLKENNTVIISNIVAKLLDVSVGDVIQTTFPDGLGGGTPVSLTVAEIFDAKVERGAEGVFGDANTIYTNIEEFNHRFAEPLKDYTTDFIIILKDDLVDRTMDGFDYENEYFKGIDTMRDVIDAVTELLEPEFPFIRVSSFRVQGAEEIVDQIGSIRDLLNLFSYILNVVGLLLIINVQSMGIDDRRNQTAVLRALGTSRRNIFSIFLIESSIIGAIGAVLGAIAGIFYGNWIQGYIVDTFELGNTTGSTLTAGDFIFAIIAGIILSVSSATIPSWKASRKNIANELRGIDQVKYEKKSNKVFFLGIAVTAFGLYSAQNVGEFWTKEAWSSFDDQVSILLGLGISAVGIGLVLSRFINKSIAYNISAVTMYGLALFTVFEAVDWVQEGNGNNWLAIIVGYIIIGASWLVYINFELLMRLISKVLFAIGGTARSTAQVMTRNAIGKKGRLATTYTTLAIILIMSVMLSSVSSTITSTTIDVYEEYSDGVDMQVSIEIPNAQVAEKISQIPEVEQVFSFRIAETLVYFEDPTSEYFDPNIHVSWRPVIEVNQSQIMPNGVWDEESLRYSFFRASDEFGYHFSTKFNKEDMMNLSKTLMNDFFANKQFDVEVKIHEDFDENKQVLETRQETQWMAIGGFFSSTVAPIYLPDHDGKIIPIRRVAAAFDMLGPYELLSYSMLVTPELAAKLPIFDNVPAANLFLVRSSNAYADEEGNLALAQEIERNINDLGGDSLSAELGMLIGASTRLVFTEVSFFWGREAAVWDFLEIFSNLGLIVGSMGMLIIAFRSVNDRKREIGMMRAVGFSRSSVVQTILLELGFVALMALFTGIVNGLIMADMVVGDIFGSELNIPYLRISTYVIGIALLALIGGLFPGVRAARIKPSHALRYTG
ncbi:MAG: FtsX-like permease family protein [Candidatus Heimdallarchaeota archaeon]|nr:FtsX-like permease family protein [Candidatus Heimdallarchaeota archaeon]